MKNKFLIHLFSLVTFSAFAKPAAIPEWVQNYRKAYPNSQYLVQRGSGDSAEKARTDATAALSRYFQTNVNANLSTTMSSVTTGDFIEESTKIVDEVNVQSQVEFFGLEYTEPYFLKSEKKWYCVVYLNRDDAWQQYKPQVEIKKNSFNGLYKNLEKESDYFTKLGMCKKVWDSGTELLEKLEYGRIINPTEEAVYQTERDRFANIPVIAEEAKNQCSVFFKIDSDYNKTLQTVLSGVFGQCGFRVAKAEGDANYVGDVSVENNITGEDPLSIKPAFNLKLVNKAGKSVYSCEIMANEKSLGYTLESAQKKAYPKLAKEIEETVKKDISSSL